MCIRDRFDSGSTEKLVEKLYYLAVASGHSELSMLENMVEFGNHMLEHIEWSVNQNLKKENQELKLKIQD